MSDKYRKLVNDNNHIIGADVHKFIPTEESRSVLDNIDADGGDHDAGSSLKLKKYLKEHDPDY